MTYNDNGRRPRTGAGSLGGSSRTHAPGQRLQVPGQGTYHGPRGTRQRPKPARRSSGAGYPLRARSINFQSGKARRLSNNRRTLILGALAIVLLVLVVVGVSSCVKSCSSKPETTENPVDARVAGNIPEDLTKEFSEKLDQGEKLAEIAANASEYENQALLELALSQPSAIDLVAAYPESDKSALPYGEEASKGTVPELYCWDVRWGNVDYAGEPLALTGSGPTSLSMAYIALTGNGKIIGPPMDVKMRTLPNGKSVVENDVPHDMPVKERVCDGYDGRTFYRPKSFSPINCKNVLVEGVTFERSVLWNVNPVYCENVIIRGITVNSTDVPSGDGIDISSCKNVLIEYSTLNCGDDCFTLKAGRCEDGLRVNKPTENVVIRYCLAKEGHGGITCGSETAGGIRNVYLHDCLFYGTRTGFRFKTRRNRGGTVVGITYENVRLVDVREAFTWDLLGSKTYMGELARRYPPLDITPLTPTVKDITIRNFAVESADRLLTVNAIPEIPCSNVLIENGKIRTNRIIRTMNDADGFTFRNLEIQATDNRMTIDDSRNVTFDDVTFYVPGNALDIEIKGNKTEGITIKDAEGNTTECRNGLNKLN